MVKTDPALRKRMMAQRDRNKRQGVSVNKSDWKKGTIRLLPCLGREVGRSFYSAYYEEERKSITLPKSFGYPDPLLDYVNATEGTGTKEAKQHLKDTLSVTREHWVPCIIRGDEGTASAPNVRAFRFPLKTYEDSILDWMVDEDIGEDVTDAREGRDVFVSKSGEGLKTKWKVQKLDPSLISKSKEMRAKLAAIAKGFDVADHFFPFSLEDYEAAYTALTGEDLPEKIRAKLEKLDAAGGRKLAASATAADDDEDGDDEDRPMKKSKKNSKKNSKRRDDEEEDEDTETDGDDDSDDGDESDDESDDDGDESDDDGDEDSDDGDEDSDDSDDDSDDDDEESDDDSDDESDDDSDDEEDDEDDEDDDKPAKGKKKSKAKKSKRSDEESDDDSDDDDDESDDDSDDEESDDDSDDDEPEEAEPAVRGGRAKPKGKDKGKPASKGSVRKPASKSKPASKGKVKPGKVKPGKVSSKIRGKK